MVAVEAVVLVRDILQSVEHPDTSPIILYVTPIIQVATLVSSFKIKDSTFHFYRYNFVTCENKSNMQAIVLEVAPVCDFKISKIVFV